MRAGQCWFHQIHDARNHLTSYGPHEPRTDLPFMTSVGLTSGGLPTGYRVLVCKHCGCLYWPHEPKMAEGSRQTGAR